jgi:hypothetical protein
MNIRHAQVDLPTTSRILQIGSADLEPLGAAIVSARRSSFGRSEVPFSDARRRGRVARLSSGSTARLRRSSQTPANSATCTTGSTNAYPGSERSKPGNGTFRPPSSSESERWQVSSEARQESTSRSCTQTEPLVSLVAFWCDPADSASADLTGLSCSAYPRPWGAFCSVNRTGLRDATNRGGSDA